MANAERGEVTLTDGEQTYTLRFGWNEIAEVETLLDIDFFADLVPKFERPSTVRGGEWRAMLWAALRGGGRTDLDLQAVGEIMNAVGMDNFGVAIGKAVELAFPSKDVVAENPPQASGSAGKKR
jgi:hypothetical protein